MHLQWCSSDGDAVESSFQAKLLLQETSFLLSFTHPPSFHLTSLNLQNSSLGPEDFNDWKRYNELSPCLPFGPGFMPCACPSTSKSSEFSVLLLAEPRRCHFGGKIKSLRDDRDLNRSRGKQSPILRGCVDVETFMAVRTTTQQDEQTKPGRRWVLHPV